MPAPRACVVIPARLNSTRLPGKMLLRETGRTLVEHTHAAAVRAKRPDAVVVATDHEEIADEVRRFGGVAVLTSPDHRSGGDRVAEVAGRMAGFEIFVNLQGDEPEIDPAAIDQVIEQLATDTDSQVATLAAPMHEPERLVDPANVKVVFDHTGRALYFSRSPIPFVRDSRHATDPTGPALFHQHIGLYAYRRDFLLGLAALPPSPLEQAENLEQLRFMQAGVSIRVGVIPQATSGIDTASDYAAFVRRCSRSAAA